MIILVNGPLSVQGVWVSSFTGSNSLQQKAHMRKRDKQQPQVVPLPVLAPDSRDKSSYVPFGATLQHFKQSLEKFGNAGREAGVVAHLGTT